MPCFRSRFVYPLRGLFSWWAIVLLVCLLQSSGLAADESKPAAPADVAELRAIESRVREVIEKALPATVGIQVGKSRGSGIVVSKDGYVLTAGHVCGKPKQECRLTFADGKTVKGTTLGIYGSADAGLIKISDPGEWPCVEMDKEAAPAPGAWCVALGHPGGYMEDRPPVVRVGRVLRADDRVIHTDCPLISGDSGGPLLNLDGKLIGINSRIGGSTTMNFHVPVSVFRENWDRLVKAESWKDDVPAKDSAPVKVTFRDVVAEARKCVAQIKCDGKSVVLGTVVGPDGWVLTKASELKGRIVCHLGDGRELDARTVGLDPRFDLAMLKVDAVGLPAIDWNLEDPEMGQFVAAVGSTEDPLSIGVVSLPRHKIPPISGVLGVLLKEHGEGARIEKVLPKSPAEKAGFKDGDVIVAVNGKKVPNREALMAMIKKHRPGEKVKIQVKREEKTLDLTATLLRLISPAAKRQEMLNRSGIGISRRHDDFPVVLQHDTVLRPEQCGSPLVDLDGKVLGVNIARGGRTETYCVPANALVGLMYDLMSGRLAPPPQKPPEEKKPSPEKQPDKKPESPEKKSGSPEKKHESPEKNRPPEIPPAPKPAPSPEEKASPKPPPQEKKQPAPAPPTSPEKKTGPKQEPKQEPKPESKVNPKTDPQKTPDKKPEPESK